MTLQEQIIQTYKINLKALSIIDKELYNRVITLDNLISKKQYIPRYNLKYIQSIKQFDILDIKTNNYLYNKKANEFIKEAVNNTNLDKLNSIDTFKDSFYNNKNKIVSKDMKKEAMVYNDIIDYTKIFNTNTNDKNIKFKKIEKFVFLGTLLGTHITKIDNKIDTNSYFIAEANLEIFRLSLFCTNYAILLQKKQIIFSIMDDRDIFINKFITFLHNNFKDNYMIKYYSSNYNIQDYFERILEAIGKINPFDYKYSDILNTLLTRSYKYINSGYKILDTKNNHNFLNNKPILILAAGPSFEKNIKWIIGNQKSFFIVAIGAVVNRLIKHNIIPDMITNVDGDKIIENQFPNDIINKIKDIPFCCSQITHKKILNKFNNIYLFEVMSTIKSSSRLIEGASVGEITLLLSYILGARDIYLLGTDLALDQKSGLSHSSDHIHSTSYNIRDKKTNDFIEDGKYSLKETTILVKGNFQENVVTTTLFNLSLISYNKIVSDIKDDKLKIYNLSDGAYINNTIPIKIDNINKKDIIVKDNQKTIKFLDLISTKFLIKDEKNLIKDSIKYIDELILEIDEFKKIEVETYKEFISKREKLFCKIIDDSKKYIKLHLPHTFISYLFIIEPYLAYNFNLDNNKNEKRVIKRVKKSWCKHIKNISKYYKDILNKNII
ncbi:MAG: 6-hydroxymethylpterin diphosphokinase MptE-like protein [Campylobacterota bacterium]|nr:6-hydroxymethylpterin diphosphokinase MptE-like protein [Campylobacterota bacterium]